MPNSLFSLCVHGKTGTLVQIRYNKARHGGSSAKLSAWFQRFQHSHITGDRGFYRRVAMQTNLGLSQRGINNPVFKSSSEFCSIRLGVLNKELLTGRGGRVDWKWGRSGKEERNNAAGWSDTYLLDWRCLRKIQIHLSLSCWVCWVPLHSALNQVESVLQELKVHND